MINELGKNIFRFLLFILIQVTILKHLELGRFINPFLYIIFILMLPIKANKAIVLFRAFLTGLLVDMFYNTMGMNAAACVFMAYCRPWVLSTYAPKGEYETSSKPTMQSLGTPWMINYAGTMILLHHLILFFLEAFTLSHFFTTLLKVLLSGAATLGLVLLSQLLMQRRPR
jgi:rod shape-determining protein MreD